MPVDGDLPFLHRLQQCGLGLGGGAVDLVGDDDVGEHGTRFELELTLDGVEGRNTGDVAREQVGRELDASHRGVDGCCQRPGKHRLSDSGDILNKKVPLGEQADECAASRFRLAVDHGCDCPEDRVGDLGEALHGDWRAFCGDPLLADDAFGHADPLRLCARRLVGYAAPRRSLHNRNLG